MKGLGIAGIAVGIVWSALGAFGCQHPAVSQDAIEVTGSQPSPTSMISNATDTEVTFDEVLQIAQGRTPEAKATLETLRDAGRDGSQVAMLARRILQRWDDGANTYYSKVPQLLESTCVDTEQLKAMYPGEVEAMPLYVEIRVAADGRPVRASVIGGTDKKQLNEAVVHSLMQKRYAPAKEQDAYLDATLTVQCRLEVR